MGTLDSDIEAGMLEVIDALGRSITFTKIAQGAFNASTMTRATTPTPYTINALRDESRPANVGMASVEEFQYTIRKTDLACVPDENDQITDTVGGVSLTLSVVGVSSAAGDLAWKIRARVKKTAA